ncbi:MMPL family transporter [Actinomadura rupiterrae]|uniref:MMPL family transporter n=1 Tax=Actinomadura rupiterrae TaxID=559627 RepID=UPI0020A43A6D|nr:MMPL family transporter [Actinomadura rupiterrae]MCP2339096.1 RND superfamily putative drug exporter [Actinomadura rupiterrae]
MTDKTLFAALGRFAARRRRWIAVAAVAFSVFAGVWGTGAFGSLTGGAGFDDPGSESVAADHVLAGPLGRHAPDVVVLYDTGPRSVDDEPAASAIRKAVDSVPRAGIADLRTYWSTGDPAFVSRDRRATYVTVRFTATKDDERVAALKRIEPSFAAPGAKVRFGGVTAMTEQVNARAQRDVARAETVSMPLLLVLLVLVFGSLVAASLPLAVGGLVMLGSFTVLRVTMMFTDVTRSAINVITILGLGLAIDYGLLMVSRFRDELAAGDPGDIDGAVARTVASAGRTIAVSGLLVAVSFAGLTVFPSRFLSSMGFAGAAVVAFAVAGSLTVLPALLRFAGHRVNALRVPLPRLGRRQRGDRWYRAAHAVMRRPLLSTVGLVAVLLALGAPFLGVNWARPGDWVLPTGADARVVTRELGDRFTADPAKQITAVVEGSTTKAALDSYARQLAGIEGVKGATVTGTHGDQARISLGYSFDPMSRQAVRTVHDLRATPSPPGTRALFTGMPASRVDIVHMIGERVPWMLAFVALVTFLVLFGAFGSVVLPVKAMLLNLLSLSAAFGAIKLVFQDGWLSGVFGFTPIGAVDANFPVLIVAIAFGLAVDYEVFLLARIREERARAADPAEAIALAVRRTSTVITSAALLMIVVVAGFVASRLVFMQVIGVGLILAVLVDATVVRGLLVPAAMRLLGEWAWWSPGRRSPRAAAPPAVPESPHART